MVTLAGYCVHSTVVPAIVPILFFAPTEEIVWKEKVLSNGRRCIGKRRKEGSGLAFNPQPIDYFVLKKTEFPGPTPLKTLFWPPVCV